MANSSLNRRTLLGGMAGVGGLALAAGCSSGAPAPATSGSAPAPGQPATINFWSYYEANARGATFADLAKKYQDANPGVTINLNLAPQNFNTVLRTAMLGSDKPEFLGITQYNMRDFAQAGLLADIGPALDEAGIKSDIYPAAISAGTLNGKLYGIADALRFGMWFYSPKGFDSLGSAQPKTYDELRELAQKARSQRKYPILFGMKDLNAATNSFQWLVPAFIGLTEMLKASAAKDYTGDKFVAALSMYRKMVDDGILDSSDTGMAAADAQALLARGEALMYPSASYAIGTLLALDPGIKAFDEPVKMTANPVATYWGGVGQMYSVTAGTRYEAAARKLLAWWVKPEQFEVQVEKSGLVSSLQSANKKIAAGSLAAFAADRLTKVEDEGLFFNNYIPSAEAEAWGRAIQEVVSKSKTAEQAIATTVQAVFKK